MKFVIASDIHGSEYYCSRLMERFAAENADRLILLGDLLYHGPRNELPRDYAPKAVAALLNDNAGKIICVRGNCEAEVDQMMLDFPVLSDSALICDDRTTFLCVHGHHLDQLPRGSYAVLYGHTHIPDKSERGGVMFFNPGSVSIPKNGSVNGYMTYENGGLLWKELESGREYDRFDF